MGKKNVCEELLDVLADAGGKQIFGVTGDALNPLLVALRDDERFSWVGVRHEENAAYAAYAQAELTGGIGICAGTVGPGSLHLINGLYNAKRERAGVVAITGQVAHRERQSGYHQEVDLVKMFDDICDFQAVIHEASQMPRLAQMAVQKAITDRAVVRIELPIDVTEDEVPSQFFRHKPVIIPSTLLAPASELERAAEVINNAKRVTLMCGIGCRDAKQQVLELSERLKAPIAHSFKGKNVFDYQDGRVVGMTGLIGEPSGYHAVMDCDCLVMIGTDFPYDVFLPSNKQVIQIDKRVENVGRRCSLAVGLVSDAKPALEALLQLTKPKESEKFANALVRMRDKWLVSQEKQASLERTDEPLHPALFARAISDRADPNAIFGVDTGESTIWVARQVSLAGDRAMVGSFNHGSLGAGYPAAMGAIALDPSREVWAFVGDGGFAMAMQDFLTAVRYDWPIKVIVFNNSQLAFVKMEMEVSGYAMNPDATDLVNPNFADFARACGGEGVRVEHAKDIVPAIEEARASSKPFIIDAVVSSGELTMPPHVTMKEAWGFGTSKVKEAILGVKGDHEQWDNWKKEFKANL